MKLRAQNGEECLLGLSWTYLDTGGEGHEADARRSLTAARRDRERVTRKPCSGEILVQAAAPHSLWGAGFCTQAVDGNPPVAAAVLASVMADGVLIEKLPTGGGSGGGGGGLGDQAMYWLCVTRHGLVHPGGDLVGGAAHIAERYHELENELPEGIEVRGCADIETITTTVAVAGASTFAEMVGAQSFAPAVRVRPLRQRIRPDWWKKTALVGALVVAVVMGWNQLEWLLPSAPPQISGAPGPAERHSRAMQALASRLLPTLQPVMEQLLSSGRLFDCAGNGAGWRISACAWNGGQLEVNLQRRGAALDELGALHPQLRLTDSAGNSAVVVMAAATVTAAAAPSRESLSAWFAVMRRPRLRHQLLGELHRLQGTWQLAEHPDRGTGAALYEAWRLSGNGTQLKTLFDDVATLAAYPLHLQSLHFQFDGALLPWTVEAEFFVARPGAGAHHYGGNG